ncbi:saccharopine dehydrogenase family protein [Pelagibacterium montanilacus]|uniref:saccharopine dehydrogenase family protein n=1 Tax=Pelagibacterium montanilacus TaxID=2185280 RepID=UPI000F8CB6E3|nr:saccharopine dehydrogenase NADP-binding domain-containing protein [Pelagibacterium montanilacus]
MKKVTIIGAGRIGATIADMLTLSSDYAVTVLDRDAGQLAALDVEPHVARRQVDAGDTQALADALAGQFAVISAAPYSLTQAIARAAREAGVHYLDLTEDVRSTRAVKEIAQGASTAFVPQCGLAPGFVSIAALSLARGFDTLEDVRMHVGALPVAPDNALNYALNWSPEGVINEYCEPCEAIVEGRHRDDVAPLEGLDEMEIDGVRYEAFNTSGGLGSTCQALAGRVRNLSYRTLRYPGHAAVMKLLLNDLGLATRRDLALEILRHAVPSGTLDKVVIHVEVTGHKNGRAASEAFTRIVHGARLGSRARSAIQLTTASGVCTVLDTLASGGLAGRGFLAQDDIALQTLLANRFGWPYAVTDSVAQVA